MFTGIIEARTKIVSAETNADTQITALVIKTPDAWTLTPGQSIAVNGACLTVTKGGDEAFTVELAPETKRKTTFGADAPEEVNLERAMPANGRFEGHMVQGHVDAVGTVTKRAEEGAALRLTVAYDAAFEVLVIEKGSIVIDGVSLTATDVRTGQCSVHVIPHTQKNTTLGDLREGGAINVEFDMLGKYMAKLYGRCG